MTPARMLCVLAMTFAIPAMGTAQSTGDHFISNYFERATRKIEKANDLTQYTSGEEWTAIAERDRERLHEMLGLSPLPERTDLKPVITGTLEHEEFTVEKLHYQSIPGLYVTANLYIPKNLEAPAPTIVFVCGHGKVVQDGISYGNKTSYQHHPAWFARNGYVCLIIDTVQLGEIQGFHKGTHELGMWWWNARGYTPAGVEAWSAIRGLDYLETRSEVDMERIGITGRSGGGVYSWWAAALDERFKVAVPVAGITDLRNHVVDGVVAGHCDCMFLVNTYGWDYARVAALVAPRPLLIANSDKDRIFPLDGIVRIYNQTRHVYELLGEGDKVGLAITEGPHKDTQALRINAFRWFNRWLKKSDELIAMPAEKLFDVKELKVFVDLPEDEINTTVHESFVAEAGEAGVPEDAGEWKEMRDGWMESLAAKSFAGWPGAETELWVKRTDVSGDEQIRIEMVDYDSEAMVPVRMIVASPAGGEVEGVTVRVVGTGEFAQIEKLLTRLIDESVPQLLGRSGLNDLPRSLRIRAHQDIVQNKLKQTAAERQSAVERQLQFAETGVDGPLERELPVEAKELVGRIAETNTAMAWIMPRGVGPSAWTTEKKPAIQIRRRFQLLGQTWHGMQLWDVVKGIEALREMMEDKGAVPMTLEGTGEMAGIALYASLFGADVERLELRDLPTSHREGPVFLNVMKSLDMPQALAMAAEKARIRLSGESANDEAWEYAIQTGERLGWSSIEIAE